MIMKVMMIIMVVMVLVISVGGLELILTLIEKIRGLKQ